MKVMFKQQLKPIERMEAIKISKPKMLIETLILKQEIIKENGQLILREYSIENNDKYNSTTNIDIFLKEGDYLIKTDRGYMKPIYDILEIKPNIEKALKDLGI